MYLLNRISYLTMNKMLSVYVGENPRGKIRKLGIKKLKVSIYKIPKMRNKNSL